MLSVVCWRWKTPGFRSDYTAERVNIFASMVRRHYHHPHRLICITDDAEGLDSSIEVVPLWDDYRHVPSPHGGGHPSCYVRLKAFAPEMRDILGERFVSVDLDCVITGDLTPLWSRTEDFVIWHHAIPSPGKNGPRNRINGSMWMMTAGARAEVWERFTSAASGVEAYRAGFHGSDQGWMQYVMGLQAGWTDEDGVYSFKYEVLRNHNGALPENARIVMFHGKPDPWDAEAMRHPWVGRHYRAEEVACL